MRGWVLARFFLESPNLAKQGVGAYSSTRASLVFYGMFIVLTPYGAMP